MCMCCTAEVDLAFPAVHSVDGGLSSQNGHDDQKDRQKGEADPGKQKEKQRPGTFTLHTVSFLSIAGTAHDRQSRRLFVSPMQEILAYFTPKNNELRKSSHSYSVTIPASTNF